jgi:hypothetical protein
MLVPSLSCYLLLVVGRPFFGHAPVPPASTHIALHPSNAIIIEDPRVKRESVLNHETKNRLIDDSCRGRGKQIYIKQEEEHANNDITGHHCTTHHRTTKDERET